MTEWIEQWHYDITPIATLPLPHEMRHPACMVGTRLRRANRHRRQLTPRPQPRDCCDYHGQDWAAVSETAIRLLSIAAPDGLANEHTADRITNLAAAEGATARDIAAIRCLVSTDDPLTLDDDGYIYGGRHRIQAMIDQGVPRTILLRLLLLDPVTGLPA